MDFFRLVHSIEELVFRFSIWLLLLPKTFLQILRHPSWVQPYVNSELDHDHDSRFQEYLSPILFWVIIAVVPMYYLGFDFFKGFLTNLELMETENFENLSPETIMAGIAFFLISGPLTFSFFLEKMGGEPISYSSIRDTYYTQTYLFGPVQLLCGLGQLKVFEIIAFSPTVDDITDTEFMWILYFLIGVSYFFVWIYQEYVVFRQVLGKGKLKTFFMVLFCMGLSYFILLFIMTALATVAVFRMEGL
ncbi:MAG: hypothetical protein ABJK11_08525 [Balneola sp.]